MLTMLHTMNTQIARPETGWRIDPEYGFLRITLNALKEGVFDYFAEDFDDTEEGKKFFDQFRDKGKVRMYIPAAEFTAEALQSLEGKPFLINAHEFKNVDNIADGIDSPAKKGVTGIKSGQIAGKPVVVNSMIECDALIDNKEAIDLITEKKLIEVSAGYDSTYKIENGKFGEQEYDAKQVNLRFNHVVALEKGQGRCGFDVRIVNSLPVKEKQIMLLKTKNSKGADLAYEFTNEADMRTADKLATELQTANEAVIADKDKEIGAAKDEIKTKNDEIQGHMATLKSLQDALAAAQEALSKFTEQEQSEGEQELVNSNFEDKDKEGVKEEIKNCGASCKTGNEKLAARRKLIVGKVMNKLGKDMKDADETTIQATFDTLVLQAKATKEAEVKTTNALPAFTNIENGAPSGHSMLTRTM